MPRGSPGGRTGATGPTPGGPWVGGSVPATPADEAPGQVRLPVGTAGTVVVGARTMAVGSGTGGGPGLPTATQLLSVAGSDLSGD